MHRIISKAFLCALVITIAALLAATETMAADTCQDECSFGPVKISGNNYVNITIAIFPDTNGNWPIVVNEPGVYSCGEDPNNYPCLAWAYTCLNDCAKINKQSILISNCCGKPIEILDSTEGQSYIDCDNADSLWPNSCSGSELKINRYFR